MIKFNLYVKKNQNRILLFIHFVTNYLHILIIVIFVSKLQHFLICILNRAIIHIGFIE